MAALVDTLAGLGDALADEVDRCLTSGALRLADDDQLLGVLAAAARVVRAAEALVVEATAHVVERSDGAAHADRLTTRMGCRSAVELVQRATRVSGRSAVNIVTAAKAVQHRVSLTTGELLPAEFPGMRAALAHGDVGVDGVVAVAAALRVIPVSRADLLAADLEVAAAAAGGGADAAPPACADDLRAQASVWAMYLDPDGSEPREARAMRQRGLTLGAVRDGIVPVRGGLLPEVAGVLQGGWDSLLSPRADDVPAAGPKFSPAAEDGADDEPIEVVADTRTRAQKQHDAFAVLLNAGVASGALPTLGGAAPTLVVTVRASDLQEGRGYAHVSGVYEPIPLAVARHVGCACVIQRVVSDDRGRIVQLSTSELVFNRFQRRAIASRDGECVIPGCRVPAEWCEIHHVVEHSRGGPTHTGNGMLLCWFHHRTIDSGAWQVRMNNGVPEVRGPAWWDSSGRWRPITKSPTVRLDRLANQT